MDDAPPFLIDEVATDAPVKKVKQPKGPKAKKRLSDFEIMRTILTRTTERKLPYILKNMGEDKDLIFLCSEEEDGFLYGSSKMTIGLLEIYDPELGQVMETFSEKLLGYGEQRPVMINIRDQMSELVKTKGESFEATIEQDQFGSSWTVRTDVRGQERTIYYSRGIESLYHVNEVRHWNDQYRFLLQASDPKHIYYDYSHPDGDTYSLITIPAGEDKTHPITQLYPHGFRVTVTRGIDLLITKQFKDFPYPIEKEELVFFLTAGTVCQMAHRVTGAGWRMVLIRPHAVMFPVLKRPSS